MDVREKLVYLVKNALRAYGKDLEKTLACVSENSEK